MSDHAPGPHPAGPHSDGIPPASGREHAGALPDERPADLSPGERSLIDAIRAPGRRTIRVETRDAKIRDLEIEEAIEFDGHRASLNHIVDHLLAEAPHQDLVIRRRDGRLMHTLRRALRFRFPE